MRVRDRAHPCDARDVPVAMNQHFTAIAMAAAGTMIAHQVAAKALRDAAFLTAWPATALPLMTLVTAGATVALVPTFSRVLDRFSPVAVVAGGFALSAAAHAAEWAFFDAGRWVAIVIYLHLAAVGAILLSGFWSLIAERFDPAGARAAYGRITASGTAAGIASSVVVHRLATAAGSEAVLALLTVLHLLCTCAVVMMGRTPPLLPRAQEPRNGATGPLETIRSPYVRTIAGFVVLTAASSTVLDFLLKSSAREALGAGPVLLRFFALYYGTLEGLSFVAQIASGPVMRRLRVGTAVNLLPGAVAAASLATLIVHGWPVIALARGIDSVVRRSLFRTPYELLFVAMDSRTRHRAKALLDVVSTRAGDAAGSGIVQAMLLSGIASTTSGLLIVAFAFAAASLWWGRQLGTLYVRSIGDQLQKYGDAPRVSVVSEAGWTLLQLARTDVSSPVPRAERTDETAAPLAGDPELETLRDLRSQDLTRVTSALARPASLGRIHVAQIIDLLAWDEVLPAVRTALERLAPSHSGMLIDAMLDPGTNFTIRRRLPRIVAAVPSQRSLDGLVSGLDDVRFEVRYHCSYAITRMIARIPALAVDRARMIALVERELSVPPQRWNGYRVIERPDLEDPVPADDSPGDQSRYVEHILHLLSTIVGREPLDAAIRGMHSPHAGIRGLALEYLDQALPAAVLERLRPMMAMHSAPEGR
jgi:ATP:ADP antiporter, AAA family